jgi:hypothetical protein
LERVVTAGLQSWIEVGEALIEIRDSRLYRIEAKTFEEYCRNKFRLEKSRVHQLMSGSKIVASLDLENSTKVEVTERAVREIAKLAPERRAEVFAAATGSAAGHVPTAREIKQVVEMEEDAASNKAPFPIETIKHSPESLKSLEEARSDSQNLSNLKWTWKKTNKQVQQRFLNWIKTN